MVGRSHQILNIKVGDYTLNQVQSFKYIGSTVNEQSTQEDDIKNRIANYCQNVGYMYRLTKDKNVPKKAKQIIHQTIFRPIIIFGNDCRTLDKKDRTADYNSINETYQNTTKVTRWEKDK